jgi:lipid II:glycine glycyltransferase (peptidoglycan interpeptide bridge formation enzyme)
MSHNITYVFNNENTKSSLEIDLSRDLDDLTRCFRKGHKSDIKRAINSGIKVEDAANREDITAFTEVYRKMCNSRSINGHTAHEVERIIHYLEENHMGNLLVARDSDSAIIGGAVFVYQGLSVRYLLSASDPDRRDLPMTHLVIYRALESAKNNGFRYFDFWGYNHFAKKDDQIYSVNSFKKGFGGYFTFFAKKMNVNLILGGYNIYRLFRVMKVLKGKFQRASQE